MNKTNEEILMKEYVKNYRKHIYWFLKYTGFCRFDIVNDQIVQLTRRSMVYNVFILIVANCSIAFLLYTSMYLGNYLKVPDGLCILHFALFANVILLNITFINTRSGCELIKNCIKIDACVGIVETAFMRKVAIRTFTALNILVQVTNILGGIFLYQMYNKIPFYLHVLAGSFFFWLFFAYDDYVFALMLSTKISLTIRYLNVALLKIGNMSYQYLPNRSLFDLLFWNKKFNKLVKFQKKASIEEFNRGFRICFDMKEVLQRYYRFTYLCGCWTIVMGSFVAVQTFIIRVKNTTTTDTRHTYVIVCWVILSWGFMIIMSTVSDMFQQQLQQTKLICSYIQLKPYKPAYIYKLTKTVLRTISMRNATPNVYNLYQFDAGFILRIAASTLVYITVQLQLAFPKQPLSSVKLNATSV